MQYYCLGEWKLIPDYDHCQLDFNLWSKLSPAGKAELRELILTIAPEQSWNIAEKFSALVMAESCSSRSSGASAMIATDGLSLQAKKI